MPPRDNEYVSLGYGIPVLHDHAERATGFLTLICRSNSHEVSVISISLHGIAGGGSATGFSAWLL
jgi:hypothetical protein